ncbi:MAG: mechanosensitive ion channel family protein [Sphingobacteriales bacterium]|nr:MAG: mechanosensitive ion channel family protein [Sphingobacteriales bacterium]
MLYQLLQISADSIANRFSGKASDWVATYGPRILIAIVVFFVGQWIIRLLNRGLKKILAARHFNPTLRPFLQNLFQILLQVLLLLGLMQLLGIQMTLFAAIIGAIGVAAGLALSGTLQNFASGVLIILLRPFRVGDNIKTQGEEGTVTEIKLFYSVVKTFSNTTLIVPNNKLSNEVIFNLTREQKRRIDISLKFKYDVDYSELKKRIEKVLDNSSDLLKDPAYRIGVEKIDDAGYNVLLNVWTNSHGFQDAKMELNKHLMEEFKSLFQKKASA